MFERAMHGDPSMGVPEAAYLAAQIPDLEVLEFIGGGGMGAVYKARQQKLDRFVALKLLHPRVQDDPNFTERFAREARTMAQLVHPHIAAIYDFGQAGDTPYLLMEYVEGVTLREAIASGSLSADRALAIVPQLCEALQYAHDAKIVHRDIKPENILIDRHGRAKIADFGLARLMAPSRDDFSLTDAHQALGTPHYMAPEQLANSHAVDHRADIYALGVVIYEMLTGELPLGRFAPPSEKTGVDPRLDEVVHKALESQPARRYQSAIEIKADMAQVCGAGSHPARHASGRVEAPLAGHYLSRIPWLRAGKSWPLKIATLGLYAVCMTAFFGVGGTPAWIRQAKGGAYYLHTVGIPDRWLEITGHQTPGQPLKLDVDFHLNSGAWLWLLGAALAYYAFWRLRQMEDPRLQRFRIPWSHVAFWAVFGLAAIVSGTSFEMHHVMYDLWSLRPIRL
jgi:tRNA A-37 threonylcarbamoyl transferase component Bud32